LVDENDEYESLVVPFDMMKHGIKVDMVPPRYGGTGGITVEGELLPYCFDDEKLYWHISKPTQDNVDTLRWIELNPPALIGEERIRRRKKIEVPHNIPWDEWRRHLAMLPEDVVKWTVLDATTQLYMEVENEHRNEPKGSTTRVGAQDFVTFDNMKLWLLILIFLPKSQISDIHVLECLLVWIRISG
jgi:hypothetical protein